MSKFQNSYDRINVTSMSNRDMASMVMSSRREQNDWAKANKSCLMVCEAKRRSTGDDNWKKLLDMQNVPINISTDRSRKMN